MKSYLVLFVGIIFSYNLYAESSLKRDLPNVNSGESVAMVKSSVNSERIEILIKGKAAEEIYKALSIVPVKQKSQVGQKPIIALKESDDKLCYYIQFPSSGDYSCLIFIKKN